MNDYSRGLIKYSSRDYDSLLKEFAEVIPKLTELWKPGSDVDIWKPESNADPGVILLKVLASVADMLGVNLDVIASEMFAPSVKQRKNAEKIFSLIGYEMGWYTAARTEVTFKNTSDRTIKIDFGFNGADFCTLNAYTDITNSSRIITYNVIPLTNKYGATDTRSKRQMTTDIDVFANSDIVTLDPNETVTRVAIEGELRSVSKSVKDIINNDYIVQLPSQHIDTTAVWVRGSSTKSGEEVYFDTQWIQCNNPAEFTQPEPRFAVVYDTYSNAQIQISKYVQQLEDYAEGTLTIYWIDCSGVIGCVGENVLSNFIVANSHDSSMYEFDQDDIKISNLSNTLELPHTNVITGRSPETAHQAYLNSRNYINTFDSIITIPDFTRFIQREPGVDCGVCIDCQKALDINLAIYHNSNLTDSQKSKMYINQNDFPKLDNNDTNHDWKEVLGLDFDPESDSDFVFTAGFKKNIVMCYAVHNDFKNSSWGEGKLATVQTANNSKFERYMPPALFIDGVIRDYRPLQNAGVTLKFGYLRVFPFYVVGTIFPTKPVSTDVGNNIVAKVKESLALYFSPANRSIGVKPTLMEVMDVVESADSRIKHFDPGSARTAGIVWSNCDIEYFNAISFARYIEPTNAVLNIRIDPAYLTDD